MQARNALLVGAAFTAGLMIKKMVKAKEVNSATRGFIDNAIAKGFAEIQNARLAIERSNSVDIKIFAQRVLDDYVNFNQRLIDVARAKKLPVPTLERYQEAAKPFLLKIVNEESFDEVYLKHRLGFHTDMIKLLRSTGRTLDPALSELMSSMVEQLNQHLHAATQLSTTCHSNEIKTSSPRAHDFAEDHEHRR